MTDADNRPTPSSDVAYEGEDPAYASVSEGKAFAGGTELRARRTKGRPPGRAARSGKLDEDDSVLLAGIEAAQAQAGRVRELVHERRELARERIREQPLAAIAAAFAGGMIVGLLMARR